MCFLFVLFFNYRFGEFWTKNQENYSFIFFTAPIFIPETFETIRKVNVHSKCVQKKKTQANETTTKWIFRVNQLRRNYYFNYYYQGLWKYWSRFGNLFLKLSGKRRKFILNFKRENMLLLVYNIGLKSHKCFNNVLATSN